MKKLIFIYLLLPAYVLWLFTGCKKEVVNNEKNPFADIKHPDVEKPTAAPDSHTIVGLHQYTFKRSCALSGCHDGNFEPDFRSVQSSYSTMVFQPIIKNDPKRSFRYRVKPGDADLSWLHEKVITDDPIISRMPVNLPPLSSGEIRAIRRWINEGAKDMFGNSPVMPNMEPVYYGIAAFAKVLNFEFRIDTFRTGSPTNPFALPQRVPGQEIRITDVDLWIGTIDRGEDSTAIDKLQINQLLISDKPDDFSSAKVIQAEFSAVGKLVPNFFNGKDPGFFFWKVKLNPQDFTPGKIYYFRYKVSDGKQTSPTYLPGESSPLYLKLYSSFLVAG